MKLKIVLASLIVSVGLLFNNFSSSVYRSDPDYIRQIGVYGYNPYTQSISNNVLKSGLPLTEALGTTKNFFYFEDSVYWWWGYRRTPYIYRGNDCQGYALTYKVCTPIISGNNNPSNCSNAINITTGSADIFSNFLKQVNNNDYYYFHKGGADYGTTWTFCISSVDANSSLCWDWSNCNLGTSLGYSGVNFDTYQNYWGDNSPGSSNSNGGSGGSTIGSGVISVPDSPTSNITNSAVYQALLNQGYYKGLCYSDFDITDLSSSSVSGYIFNQYFTGFSLNAGESYGGADFFDLASDSNLSKNSFFNMYNNLFKYSYSNQVLSSFDGKPKGLWRIFYKINYPSTNISNFSITDYLTFCDMSVNGYVGDAKFVGEVSVDTSEKIKTVLDTENVFILSPNINLWSTGTYEGEKDWFDMFQSLHGQIMSGVNVGNGTGPGSLPNYIIVAFLVAIFYYILKR